MGIGSVTSTSNTSGMQMLTAASTDPKIKNIQNEITDAKLQMQKLSSKEELSANEKADERKKLQKEISGLNTELKQHQEELRKSQRREIMLAELREEQSSSKDGKTEDEVQTKETALDQTDKKNPPNDEQKNESQETVISRNSDGVVILKPNTNQNRGVDTEKEQADEPKEEVTSENETEPVDSDMVTDASLSHKDMHAMVSARTSVQHANRQGTIIARTRDGIAVLKGEMHLDEQRGVNTERKQAELEKMEQKEEKATAFQFSVLGEANNAMKSASETDVSGINSNIENNAFINALKVSQEEQSAQQMFYVSFG